MKKIIVGVIVTILVAIILNHKNIYRVYKLNQIKNDIINTLNGKFNDRTYQNTIRDYELYHKSIEELNHYNITELIDKYIEKGEESVEIYKNGIHERFFGGSENINGPVGLEYGKDIRMKIGEQLCIEDNLTDIDIENYNEGTFRTHLTEKLKTCLDYEEKEGKIEWQINSTKDMRIELPYDCYINYKAYHREDNKEFKKAVDVVFSKEFKLGEKGNFVIIKYETTDGSIKEQETRIYYTNKDNKEYYDIALYDGLLVIDADTLAEAYLSSHTVDRKKEENELRVIGEWFDN